MDVEIWESQKIKYRDFCSPMEIRYPPVSRHQRDSHLNRGSSRVGTTRDVLDIGIDTGFRSSPTRTS